MLLTGNFEIVKGVGREREVGTLTKTEPTTGPDNGIRRLITGWDREWGGSQERYLRSTKKGLVF